MSDSYYVSEPLDSGYQYAPYETYSGNEGEVPYSWDVYNNNENPVPYQYSTNQDNPDEFFYAPAPPVSTEYPHQPMYACNVPDNNGSFSSVDSGYNYSESSFGTSSPNSSLEHAVPFQNQSTFDDHYTVPTIPCAAPILYSLPAKCKTNDKFDEVSGRLCLLSGSRKFPITVNEIMRRIYGPEGYNHSLLGGMLRKGKGKDNGKRLRSQLQVYNIAFPSGKRKTAPTTGFTAFCEEEVVLLARDFSNILSKDGKADILSKVLTDELLYNNDPHEVLDGVEFLRELMESIVGMHSILPENPDDVNPITPEEVAINHFSMFTHGFGHNCLRGLWTFLLDVSNYGASMCQAYLNQVNTMPQNEQQTVCEDFPTYS